MLPSTRRSRVVPVSAPAHLPRPLAAVSPSDTLSAASSSLEGVLVSCSGPTPYRRSPNLHLYLHIICTSPQSSRNQIYTRTHVLPPFVPLSPSLPPLIPSLSPLTVDKGVLRSRVGIAVLLPSENWPWPCCVGLAVENAASC